MESPLICIVRGNPSPEELAALVTVLLARAGQAPTPADASHARGRASWQQRPDWKSPAAWAAARQRGESPCRQSPVRLSQWPTTENSPARARTKRQHALTMVQGKSNGNTATADSCELQPAVVPLHLVNGAVSPSNGGTPERNGRC
ncbi:acyl-CoA carboxylase subunit epsilon [Geodermatophilus sp. SYSU D01176]